MKKRTIKFKWKEKAFAKYRIIAIYCHNNVE